MRITVPKLEQNETYRQIMQTFNSILESEFKARQDQHNLVDTDARKQITAKVTDRMKDYLITLKNSNVIEFCPQFKVVTVPVPDQFGGYHTHYLLRCDSLEMCRCLKIDLPQATYQEVYQPYFN